MLVIGSRALIAQGFNLGRQPKDWDYVCTYEEYREWIEQHRTELKAFYPLSGNKFVAFSKAGTIYEFEISWPGSTAEELLQMELGRTHASPEVCLALKMSHRYLKNSPHFLKTMEDIWMLRRHCISYGPLERLADWVRRREKETYTYKHPNLKQDKKGFFDASVKYTYDHDAIHRAVAYGDVPAYRLYMEDGAEVNCDKSKFFAITQEERLHGVAEEAYVLALERSLIPFPGVLTPEKAFKLALMKVCTSITSGWFREFAWENYYKVVEIYNENYVDQFNRALAAGKIPLVQALEKGY